MDQTCRERMDKKLKGDNYSKRIDSIRRFERQLTDNGYVLLKFFYADRPERTGKTYGHPSGKQGYQMESQ